MDVIMLQIAVLPRAAIDNNNERYFKRDGEATLEQTSAIVSRHSISYRYADCSSPTTATF